VSDGTALRVLVEEAGTPLPVIVAEAALESCVQLKEAALAGEIIDKASKSDADFLRGIVEKATIALKEGKLDRSAAGQEIESSDPLDLPMDFFTEAKQQKEAATSSKEIAMRANDIRSCGKNGDLKGAIKVFERLGSQAHSTLILNSLLDACVECKDMAKAVEYFNQPELHAVSDVISYNTMMKGYIASGQEVEAKRLLAELSENGLGATRTSFHGLLNARVNAGDFNGAWKLVSEMQANGISPNAVTCSILMKSKMTSMPDLSRVLALIDTMDQPMDEVLFPAVVEACILLRVWICSPGRQRSS
jgi:pentatricopeptide repeat protein